MSNRMKLNKNQQAALEKYYQRYIQAKTDLAEASVVLNDLCVVIGGLGAQVGKDESGVFLIPAVSEEEN